MVTTSSLSDRGTQKRGIVSPGTKHTAIWRLDVAGLYTILSMKKTSVQDFAGFMPATGSSLPPPAPASLISVSVLSWIGSPPFPTDPPVADSESP
jgi:hypothetical protein